MRLPRLHRSLVDPGLLWVQVGQWILMLILTASLGASVWLWMDGRSAQDQAGQYEQATGRLQETNRAFVQEAARAGVDLSDTRLQTLGRDVTFVNQLLDKQTFSWTRFLSDLESAVPPRVSLASVTLNFKDAALTLNGTALALRDLAVFVNELERHSAFRNVVLAQHRLKGGGQEAVRQSASEDAPAAVEFTLTVTYRPPS